jgi:hypothetical protein
MIERDGLRLVCGQRLRRPFGSLMGGRRMVVKIVDGDGGIPEERSPQIGSLQCKCPSVGLSGAIYRSDGSCRDNEKMSLIAGKL